MTRASSLILFILRLGNRGGRKMQVLRLRAMRSAQDDKVLEARVVVGEVPGENGESLSVVEQSNRHRCSSRYRMGEHTMSTTATPTQASGGAAAPQQPGPQQMPEPLGMREVFAFPVLRRLWYAQVVSVFGDFLALFA